MDSLLFHGWPDILRILVVGVLAYVALVALLRLFGKRTLSKMNAFDFVVTVALGSTLATVLLSRDVALLEGVLAFGLLILLQFVVTWSSVRLGWVRRIVTGEPALLLFRGELLEGALRRARVTEQEVRAAVRGAGYASLSEAEAVVLETDGSISVVAATPGGRDRSSLEGVHRPR